MSGDPFGLPTKKKMVAYACVAGAIVIGGCVVAISQGVPLLRVLLLVGFLAVIFGGMIAGTIWLSGGKRTDVSMGPAGVKPPIRIMKALPYLIVLIALFYVLKLVEVFSAR